MLLSSSELSSVSEASAITSFTPSLAGRALDLALFRVVTLVFDILDEEDSDLIRFAGPAPGQIDLPSDTEDRGRLTPATELESDAPDVDARQLLLLPREDIDGAVDCVEGAFERTVLIRKDERRLSVVSEPDWLLAQLLRNEESV